MIIRVRDPRLLVAAMGSWFLSGLAALFTHLVPAAEGNYPMSMLEFFGWCSTVGFFILAVVLVFGGMEESK